MIPSNNHEEVQGYLRYLNSRLLELDKEKEFITKQIQEITHWGVPQTTLPPPVVPMPYPFGATWIRKAEFILIASKRALSAPEIMDQMIAYEPTLKENIKSLTSSVTSMLHENSKEGGILLKTKIEKGYEYKLK